MDMEVERKKR